MRDLCHFQNKRLHLEIWPVSRVVVVPRLSSAERLGWCFRETSSLFSFTFAACSRKKRQMFGVFLLKYFLARKNIPTTNIHIAMNISLVNVCFIRLFISLRVSSWRDSSDTFISNSCCWKSLYSCRQTELTENLQKIFKERCNSYNSPFFVRQTMGDKQLNYFSTITGVVKYIGWRKICRTGHLQKWLTLESTYSLCMYRVLLFRSLQVECLNAPLRGFYFNDTNV